MTSQERRMFARLLSAFRTDTNLDRLLLRYAGTVGRLLKCDYYGIVLFPSSKFPDCHLISNNPQEFDTAYASHLMAQDFVLHKFIEQEGSTVTMRPLLTDDVVKHNVFYNETNRLRPYSDICYSPVTLGGERIGFLGIARPPDYPEPFCDSDLSFFSITSPLLDNALSAFLDREKTTLLAKGTDSTDSATLFVHADGSLEATRESDFRLLRSLCGIKNAKRSRDQDNYAISEIMARMTSCGNGHCLHGSNAVSIGLNRYTVRWRSVRPDPNCLLGYSDIMGIITIQKPTPIYDLDRATSSLSLSPREKEIVKLLFRGRSNKQISESLFIAEDTVKRHVSNILGKAEVRSRSQLIFKLVSMQ